MQSSQEEQAVLLPQRYQAIHRGPGVVRVMATDHDRVAADGSQVLGFAEVELDGQSGEDFVYFVDPLGGRQDARTAIDESRIVHGSVAAQAAEFLLRSAAPGPRDGGDPAALIEGEKVPVPLTTARPRHVLALRQTAEGFAQGLDSRCSIQAAPVPFGFPFAEVVPESKIELHIVQARPFVKEMRKL